MAHPPSDTTTDSAALANERRSQARGSREKWRTAITCIEPNKILIRGYPVDELMGRLGFGEAIYLLLMGELPTPAIGRLMSALLISSLDHGVTPPSTLAARNVATTSAPVRASVAAGVLAFGPYHGGDISSCMMFLDSGLSLVREGLSIDDAARRIVERCVAAGRTPPGFGHRFHARDPRAARLFQMALELELEGEHITMMRAVERVLLGAARRGTQPASRQRGRCHCRRLRRSRLRRRARQRALSDLACAGTGRARSRRATARAAHAPDRSERSHLRRSAGTAPPRDAPIARRRTAPGRRSAMGSVPPPS